MTPEQALTSQVTVFSKYARFWGELGRRETYPEIVGRNRQMHLDHLKELGKDTPEMLALVDEAYRMVADRKLFPSMRSFQFGGEAILKNNTRIYNCSFRYADEPSFFNELMFLLLCGTGVGYSVQKQHVEKLPAITEPTRQRVHLIEDSIEGWADAIKVLVDAYLNNGVEPIFDYSAIRPEGSIIKTSGGRAPGAGPLEKTIVDLRIILRSKKSGEKLRPIDVHDMATIIARAVLSGGIRRSAMISLFSPDDMDMLTCKMGEWWNVRPERAFANNSAVLLRGRDDNLFHEVFQQARESGSGEPGIFWTDDEKYGTNPCAEITLNNKQFCNLTTINAGTIESQEDFNLRARAAGIIGTLQASYTKFDYLGPEWEAQTEEEALLGVSMTGIASGAIRDLDATEAAAHAVAANHQVAEMLGINKAARVTSVKPEGTASLVAGTSSGIHAWHDSIYLRRMRYNKGEPIAKYLIEKFGIQSDPNDNYPAVVEQDVFNPHQIILAIPQRAPEGAATRSEGAMAILERVKRYNREWIRPGNEYGGMTNNISATINIQEHEWDAVRDWMWNNRYEYNGLSILPYSDHTYRQAPYQTIDEATFNRLSGEIKAANLDLTEINEVEDYTDLSGELACAGGACELPW